MQQKGMCQAVGRWLGALEMLLQHWPKQSQGNRTLPEKVVIAETTQDRLHFEEAICDHVCQSHWSCNLLKITLTLLQSPNRIMRAEMKTAMRMPGSGKLLMLA